MWKQINIAAADETDFEQARPERAYSSTDQANDWFVCSMELRMTVFDRRSLLTAAPGLALLAGASEASAARSYPTLQAALYEFARLPGVTSYQIDVGDHGKIFRTAFRSSKVRFVGSAVKTFILAKFLQDVEDGRLSLSDVLDIDDSVRSLSSQILGEMTGKMPAKFVLEGMISHSDNTATDAAIKQVGPDRVRAFIRSAGLKSVRIPDSTRRLFSYIAGAPAGVDEGWEGMKRLESGQLFGTPRPAFNNVESMLASCNDFVSYYQRALKGQFFKKQATLTEFKRIQAMADAISLVVPPDLMAYAKGGSIDDFTGFHALCVPGQMILGKSGGVKLPVTFCFMVNWNGPDEGIPAVLTKFASTISTALAEVERAFG
jgi:beta-lactamase class A